MARRSITVDFRARIANFTAGVSKRRVIAVERGR